MRSGPLAPSFDDLRQDERVVGSSAICGPAQQLNRSLTWEDSGDEAGRLAGVYRQRLSVDSASWIPSMQVAAFGADRGTGEGPESTHCCRFPHDKGGTAVDPKRPLRLRTNQPVWANGDLG